MRRRPDWELIGIVVVGVLGLLAIGCSVISIVLTMRAGGAW